jgi:hypothetical protein
MKFKRRRRPLKPWFEMNRVEIVVPTSRGEAVFPGLPRKMAFGHRNGYNGHKRQAKNASSEGP